MLENILKFFIFLLIKLIPKDKNLLVFGDRAGIRFADNSRYLYLYLSKKHKELKCVWITKNKKIYNNLKKNKLLCYYNNSIMGYYYSLRAKYHLFNFIEDDINKIITYSSDCILLWHGVLPKRAEIPKMHTKKNIINNNLKKLIIYPNKFMAENIIDHFHDKKYKLFMSGLPRNIIFNSEKINSIYYKTDEENKFIDDLKNQKKNVFGYFPTWRVDGIELFRDAGNQDNLSELNEILNKNNSIMLIKKHMNSEKKDMNRYYNSEIEKITNLLSNLNSFKFIDYDFDLNSILEICDVLVSDYSGVIFDYLYLERPIIIYAPDYDDFLNKTGFNLDPIKEGFCHNAFNFNQLKKLINNYFENPSVFKNKHSESRKKIHNKVFLKKDINSLVDLIKA